MMIFFPKIVSEKYFWKHQRDNALVVNADHLYGFMDL